MAREQRWTTDSKEAKTREERALATERDRIVRNNSVANDIRLNLPVSVQMPDGEEHFSKPNPRLLPYDTRSEIQRPYIKPPPNKSVCCTPDWDDCIGPSPCSCGPVVSQSVPKCSTSGQHSSGWSLSWSRSSKSPPSHSRHRCQRHTSHPHPSNPSSNTRHSTANSSGLKQKSSLGPQSTVCGFLIGAGSADKSHNTVQCRSPTCPSITERLQNSPAEKVHHSTSAAGGNTRTSPNNNISITGVLARLVDEPLFSSNKRNGQCKKSPRNEPSAGRTLTPSESNLTVRGHISDVMEDLRGLNNTRQMVTLPDCSSGITHYLENIPTSSTSVYDQSKSSGSEDGDSNDEKTRNDNNGNTRVPPVIGRHGDNLEELVEQRSSFTGSGIHTSCSETEDRGSYSKNVSSTTDSSLYHPSMHPRFGSALSESIKETAHSELSETYTANQLSDQYCSAEIASTSSICSTGQSKDVRSLRDVT